jgi:hypothetical protein
MSIDIIHDINVIHFASNLYSRNLYFGDNYFKKVVSCHTRRGNVYAINFAATCFDVYACVHQMISTVRSPRVLLFPRYHRGRFFFIADKRGGSSAMRSLISPRSPVFSCFHRQQNSDDRSSFIDKITHPFPVGERHVQLVSIN